LRRKKIYIHVYINPAPLCKINKEPPQGKEEKRSGGGESKKEMRRRGGHIQRKRHSMV